MIQVSDRVKQTEATRRERADGRLNEFPYEMLGDQLAHRPGFPRIPPPPPQPGFFAPDPDRYANPFLGPRDLQRDLRFGREQEEEDPRVVRRPNPGHAEPEMPRDYPFPFPFDPPPIPGFIYDRNTRMYHNPLDGYIFDTRDSTLYDPRTGTVRNLRSGEIIQVHPPRNWPPCQCFHCRHNPNNYH